MTGGHAAKKSDREAWYSEARQHGDDPIEIAASMLGIPADAILAAGKSDDGFLEFIRGIARRTSFAAEDDGDIGATLVDRAEELLRLHSGVKASRKHPMAGR